MDRRKAPRYAMRVPVLFRWTSTEGIGHRTWGISRDVSSKGIFVYSSEAPPQTSLLAMELVLREPGEGGGGGVRLEASGQVVRVEATGFAVVLTGELTESPGAAVN